MYLAKHLAWNKHLHIRDALLEISVTHHILHFKYVSFSSNESDMRVQARSKATTFKAKAKA